MKNGHLPNHIALIPDGNRRWARERGLHSLEGHKKGLDAVIDVSRRLRERGVSTFTAWGFSTENWKRAEHEVGYLMGLFDIMIDRFVDEAIESMVKITHLGRKDRLPKKLIKKIRDVEEKTKGFSKFYLNIALDYGGRDEIVRACNRYITSKSNGELMKSDVLSDLLDTNGQPYPYPDLLIRTGGEQRLSGFMLWQIEYSELIFVDKYLPDFTPNDIDTLLDDYAERHRRFGK